MPNITLAAADGHTFSAYAASAIGKPRGGLVVVQEIFGVNAHIRRVADGYARDGYEVLAPAVFDRAERGTELGYDKTDVDRGIALRASIPLEQMLHDIAACADALSMAGRVGIVGYCLGGSLAWLTACRLDGFAAAVGYYGGMIAANLGESPRIPVMLHFGEQDGGIPMTDVARIRAATDPAQVQIFTYPGAGHAFNRDGNQAYHPPSSDLARSRTLAFLAEHVG